MRTAAVSALVGLLVLAGCAAPDKATPADPVPHDAAGGDAPAGPAGGRGDANATLPAPAAHATTARLVDVTAQLRSQAAELVVPAGEYHLVRLVYDESVWGEATPWDGEAEVMLGMAYDLEGEGAAMDAFGFASPFADDEPIQPLLSFVPLEGPGLRGSWTLSTCSGCEGGPPRHERALLMGGASELRLRIGVVSELSQESIEALWDRPAVAIGAEASTRDVFLGLAVRSVVLASESTYSAGVLQTDWGASAAPGVSVEREVTHRAAVQAIEPGVFALQMYGDELVGAEEWSYSLQAEGLSGAYAGLWAHEPTGYSAFLALTGAFYPPFAAAQGTILPGPVSFEAQRTITGASEPSGLVRPSYEYVAIGHAGVDLEALYGWDVDRAPNPTAGFRHCIVVPGAGASVPQPCFGGVPA